MSDVFASPREVVSYLALVIGAVLILRSKVKTDNLRDLKERVDILEKERSEARLEHVENQKAIANLEGQLNTYKEIPLQQIASSLTELSQGNGQILNVLQSSALIASQEKAGTTHRYPTSRSSSSKEII